MKQSTLLLVFLLLSFCGLSQNTINSDSLKMYINLKECKKFEVYYEDKLLFKSGTSSSEDTLITFYSVIGKGQLPITVFKKGIFGYRNSELTIYYESNKKYLVLFRNSRVKRRYFFDVKWVNFLPLKFDNL